VPPRVTIAQPPRPPQPALAFEPRKRFIGHAIWAGVAYFAFLFIIGADVTYSAPYVASVALSFAATVFMTQLGIRQKQQSFSTLILAIIVGVVVSTITVLGADALLNQGGVFNVQNVILDALPIVAAWAIAGVFLPLIYQRVIVTPILIAVGHVLVNGLILDYGFNLNNISPVYIALMGTFPWLIEILYGERKLRTHWFNWAETTDRFIARTLALSIVIGTWSAVFLNAARRMGRSGFNNEFYRYGENTPLILAEAAIIGLILALVISGMIGWVLSDDQSKQIRRGVWRPKGSSVLRALIVIGIVGASLGAGWASVMRSSTDFAFGYPAQYEGLTNIADVLWQEGIYINPFEANIVMFAVLSLAVGITALLSASTGETRTGHIFKGGTLAALLVGIPLGLALSYLAADGRMIPGVVALNVGGIFIFCVIGSLAITIPLWLADYLAGDKP
jgi:hypothetical protein